MSRKSLLFGGLSVASIATITPTGIHFQKEAQRRKERQKFISRSDVAVNELNEDSENESLGITFLKNSEDDDKWKLMWIIDIWNYYKKEEIRKTVKDTLDYTKEEMNHFEKTYWDSRVLKQQGKWDKKMTEQWLKYANSKSQYWEKFKEMCLILMVNEKIDKDENMNTSRVEDYLCVFSEDMHKEQLKKYEEYKNKSEPRLGIMEYFWKVVVKSSTSSTK